MIEYSDEELTKEEIELAESEINYICKKRSTQVNGEFFVSEVSMNVNPLLGVNKTAKYIDRRLAYELQSSADYARKYGIIK